MLREQGNQLRPSNGQALFVIVFIGTLSIVGCSPRQDAPAGSRPNTSRVEAAEFAATGVIAAAAAREPAGDPADYYGRALSASERAALLAAVPSTLGSDPILYEARFASDSARSDSVTAVVSLSSTATPAFEVALTWDPTAQRSPQRDVDLPGNWLVTSVGVVSER